MKTTKALSIAGDYKKLEEKLLELTKDNFSWSIEYEDEETNDMETLILCDFVYREDPFGEGGLLQVKAVFVLVNKDLENEIEITFNVETSQQLGYVNYILNLLSTNIMNISDAW